MILPDTPIHVEMLTIWNNVVSERNLRPWDVIRSTIINGPQTFAVEFLQWLYVTNDKLTTVTIIQAVIIWDSRAITYVARKQIIQFMKKVIFSPWSPIRKTQKFRMISKTKNGIALRCSHLLLENIILGRKNCGIWMLCIH